MLASGSLHADYNHTLGACSTGSCCSTEQGTQSMFASGGLDCCPAVSALCCSFRTMFSGKTVECERCPRCGCLAVSALCCSFETMFSGKAVECVAAIKSPPLPVCYGAPPAQLTNLHSPKASEAGGMYSSYLRA